MVFELREGEVFLLGASSWRADTITSDRVLVTPAAGEPGKMPFWHGDRAGRTPAFGARIGALTRRIADAKPAEAARFLEKEHRLDESAAMNLVSYVADQLRAGRRAERPDDRARALRRRDRRLARVRPHAVRLARARAVGDGDPREAPRVGPRRSGRRVVGRRHRVPHHRRPTSRRVDLFFPSSDEVESLVTDALSGSSLFAARFREAAARALLLPRRAPGRALAALGAAQTRVGSARRRFALSVVSDRARDVPRVPARRVRSRRAARAPPPRRDAPRANGRLDSTSPSPFASSLLFSFVANFIYDGDAPLAERRAHALSDRPRAAARDPRRVRAPPALRRGAHRRRTSASSSGSTRPRPAPTR